MLMKVALVWFRMGLYRGAAKNHTNHLFRAVGQQCSVFVCRPEKYVWLKIAIPHFFVGKTR